MNKKDNIINEIIKNLSNLIECVTIKENYKEFDKAFDIVKEELKDYYIREIIINNYKNLVISNTEDKNLDIIFCAHMDVVPNEEYKVTIKDGNLYGRGSFDMKSGLSVIMSLLKNNKTNKKVAFIITSDEEIGGFCCKEILKEYNSFLAIIPDAGKNFELIVEEKGLLQLEITSKGINAHASEPYNGDNAILKLINIYEELLKIYRMPQSKNEFMTSVNLSKINGGTSINLVPDKASMILDIRFTKENTIESIIDNIKKLSNDIEIKVLDSGPTFYVDYKLPIIQDFINKANDILGEEIKIGKCVATSDAIYFSEKNIPTILINPIGDNWHKKNEYVKIDSLYTLYELFKTLL
ncbi:MAG: M20/M25/M40 family metallo-hydrolase [Bacilli bacterium]|nr:M20/M25/M40 family metallo-hydrolase [Bacilli bacterium]